jgi:NTE family protein
MMSTVDALPLSPALRDPGRPRMALVLGSGGVRSAAAIGVADVLADEGLRPDLLVGCSSGALFGATLALQLPPAQALELVLELWSPELTSRKRWLAYVQLLLPRLSGFGSDFGLRDSSLIGVRMAQAFGDRRIQDLTTPLRIIATDAGTGSRVVLTEGPLVASLKASMAVPFLFPAVTVGGRQLLDGVISDPLPVSAAADADVVLTLGFHGAMPRRVDRPARLFGRVSTALINNLMQARLDAAQAAGQALVALELPLERRVGLWETAALPHVFRAGQRAAQAALPAIRRALQGRQAVREAMDGARRALA